MPALIATRDVVIAIAGILGGLSMIGAFLYGMYKTIKRVETAVTNDVAFKALAKDVAAIKDIIGTNGHGTVFERLSEQDREQRDLKQGQAALHTGQEQLKDAVADLKTQAAINAKMMEGRAR